MKLAWIAVALTACWTGDVPEPAAPAPTSPTTTPAPPAPRVAIDVKLERGACFGRCPVYTVEIAHDGAVAWHGTWNVQVMGDVHARIAEPELRRLARGVDAARFFDRDESGKLPVDPCVRTGNTVTCSARSSFCTDTSHTVITITRGAEVHRVDDAHCGDSDPKLVELEELIDRVARVQDWIGDGRSPTPRP